MYLQKLISSKTYLQLHSQQHLVAVAVAGAAVAVVGAAAEGVAAAAESALVSGLDSSSGHWGCSFSAHQRFKKSWEDVYCFHQSAVGQQLTDTRVDRGRFLKKILFK